MKSSFRVPEQAGYCLSRPQDMPSPVDQFSLYAALMSRKTSDGVLYGRPSRSPWRPGNRSQIMFRRNLEEEQSRRTRAEIWSDSLQFWAFHNVIY